MTKVTRSTEAELRQLINECYQEIYLLSWMPRTPYRRGQKLEDLLNRLCAVVHE